jgi:N-methylhydantoinase A
LRFFRQINEMQVLLPDGVLDGQASSTAINHFRTEYEKLVGPGTADSDALVEVVNLTAEATLQISLALMHSCSPSITNVSQPARHRTAWLAGAYIECPVGEVERRQGRIDGPALIAIPTTTIVVYPGQSAELDDHGPIRLDFGAQ